MVQSHNKNIFLWRILGVEVQQQVSLKQRLMWSKLSTGDLNRLEIWIYMNHFNSFYMYIYIYHDPYIEVWFLVLHKLPDSQSLLRTRVEMVEELPHSQQAIRFAWKSQGEIGKRTLIIIIINIHEFLMLPFESISIATIPMTVLTFPAWHSCNSNARVASRSLITATSRAQAIRKEHLRIPNFWPIHMTLITHIYIYMYIYIYIFTNLTKGHV